MSKKLFPKGIPLIKRLFDLIITVPIFVFFAPFMLLISLLIAWQHGWPIIFRQKRPGFKGELFTIFKFRSMRDLRDAQGDLLQFWNAEAKLLKEVKCSQSVSHICGTDWRTDGDLAFIRDGREIAIVDSASWRTVFTDKVYSVLGHIFGASFAPFRARPDSEPYLGVLVRFRASSQRSMLLVYSPSGERVYEEMLDRTTTSLCAVPHPDEDGIEFLLVGSGVGEVTAYHFNGKADR